LPSKSELAKTIIAFANDAGGELYIGVKNDTREVIGLQEDELISIEEKICNLIHDNCSPLILPEVSFLLHNGKYIILSQIFKGSAPPYHLKNKSVDEGTYIRVGSSNRLASKEIISELERCKLNISFDSERVYIKSVDELNINSFKEFYFEKTGEELTMQVLQKLELIKSEQKKTYPTNALILLSDDVIRREIFPYAKIECARFKGTIPGDFIDQKTIDSNIAIQSEEAYKFVLRHISEASVGYKTVYRKNRWEYPLKAIREVIRNAVIHRDYSLNGKDIKIAIFDDKVEITSPGKLLPSVDFSVSDSGQSDIRNKVLAPVFKRLGIIEQWGNGLRIISEDIDNYPEISLNWKEPGIAFRVTFSLKNYLSQQESLWVVNEPQQELQQELNKKQQELSKPQQESQQELNKTQQELQHELNKPQHELQHEFNETQQELQQELNKKQQESRLELQQELNLKAQQELQHELNKPQHESQYEFNETQQELQQELDKKQQESQQELLITQQELQQESLYSKVIKLINDNSLSRKELSVLLGQKSISGQLNETISKLLKNNLIEWTIKEKPNSSKQKYKITLKGIEFIKSLHKK